MIGQTFLTLLPAGVCLGEVMLEPFTNHRLFVGEILGSFEIALAELLHTAPAFTAVWRLTF